MKIQITENLFVLLNYQLPLDILFEHIQNVSKFRDGKILCIDVVFDMLFEHIMFIISGDAKVFCLLHYLSIYCPSVFIIFLLISGDGQIVCIASLPSEHFDRPLFPHTHPISTLSRTTGGWQTGGEKTF